MSQTLQLLQNLPRALFTHLRWVWTSSSQFHLLFSDWSAVPPSQCLLTILKSPVLWSIIGRVIIFFVSFCTEITAMEGLSLLLVCSHLLIVWGLGGQLSFVVNIAHGFRFSYLSALPLFIGGLWRFKHYVIVSPEWTPCVLHL